MLATTKKGNKPDFHQSASGVKAKSLYQHFFKQVQDQFGPDKVKDGLFAAMMDVALVNDGPVGLDYTCLDNEVHPRYLQGTTRIHQSHANLLTRSLSKLIPTHPS